jgi:Yip1 domain
MADSTTVGVLTNIFTTPSLAFAAIKERPNPWLPMLVIILGTCAVQFVYTQSVDLAWMLDRQFEAANMTEEEREQAVEGAMRIPPLAYGFIVAIPAAIAILVIYSLIALYYTGVSFATNDGIKFGQWLALIAWCSLPSVLGLAASLVNLVVTDARFLPAEQLNPLSFGSLLAIDPQGATTVERILLSLDVTVLWSTVLQILGYQAFTQSSIVRATIVVLGPLAVIVLIASLFALT